jgi:alpha-beta hydrolase superfamily lysophospholipase
LIFMHGLNDYAGRYAFLGQMFAQENIDFVCIDQRGHGRSDGQRGHFESISQLANEQAKLLESYSDLPVFLVGDQAGVLTSLQMIATADDATLSKIHGTALVEPFTAFSDPAEAQRPVAMFRMASYFMKNANHPSYKVPRPPLHKMHWSEDSLAP